jgi:hypothetical protein
MAKRRMDSDTNDKRVRPDQDMNSGNLEKIVVKNMQLSRTEAMELCCLLLNHLKIDFIVYKSL